MVKKINNPKFICEWPGCGEEYKKEKQAIDCEMQGFIGPNLKPGLVLKQYSDFYDILIGECDSIGHQRQYSFICFKRLKSHVPKRDKWQTYKSIFKTGELENNIKSTRLQTLSKKEFKKIKGQIEKEKGLENIREILEKNNIQNLRRYSPYIKGVLDKARDNY